MRRTLIAIACLFLLPSLLMAVQASPGSSPERDAEIREAVGSFIQKKTSGLVWETRIKRLSMGDVAKLPEGVLEYEVVAPQQWEGYGNASIAVVVRKSDKVVRNIPVRVEVEALADMVVALRQIDYGTTIDRGDIVIQKRDVATSSSRYAGNINEIIGKRARMTIRANMPVRLDQVEKLPIVKTGQMVSIIAENEIMKITVAGRARGTGAEGDIIMVQNLNSLKEIPARIVNASTVQVGF